MFILEIGLVFTYGLSLLFMTGFSLAQWQLTRQARRALAAGSPPVPPDPAVWPLVTVQLPVYNELHVVERIIDAAAALDYPAGRLHIQVLDDSTDESVALAAARVAHYQQQGLSISHVRRASRQGYKAGALAYGLTETNGEYIAIFDADFVPEPDFLRRTLPHFTSANVGMVQTRWGHLNEDDSLLTQLQAFGLNAHFLVEQVGRTAAGYFINFNGTGGIWRRTCIEDAGGWQADTLTEDLDLSYRAQLRGWQFNYLSHVLAPAELPTQLSALKSQQHRWNKGAAETARKHLARIWRAAGLPISTKLHASAHLLNSSVFIAILLMAVTSVPLVLVLVFRPEFKLAFQLATVFLLSFVPLFYYYRTAWQLAGQCKGKPWFAGRFLLFLAVSLGLMWPNARAVWQGLRRQPSPFVRTPKLGISGSKGPNSTNLAGVGVTGAGGRFLLVQVGFMLYFLAGLGAGLYYGKLGLVPFHLLLLTGHGIILYYALQERFPTSISTRTPAAMTFAHRLLLLLLPGVVASACQRRKAEVPEAISPLYTTMLSGLLKETVPFVSVAQLKAQPAPVLLDTRAPREYAVSHLAGARWVGYEEFSLARVQDLPKDTSIVVYCSVGLRSERVGEQLRAAGYTQVRNLYGGLFEWVNAGYPTVAVNNAPTTRVHAFSPTWGIWLRQGEKVYE